MGDAGRHLAEGGQFAGLDELGVLLDVLGAVRGGDDQGLAALVADGLIKVELEKRENVYIIGKIVDRTEVYFYAETATDSQL